MNGQSIWLNVSARTQKTAVFVWDYSIRVWQMRDVSGRRHRNRNIRDKRPIPNVKVLSGSGTATALATVTLMLSTKKSEEPRGWKGMNIWTISNGWADANDKTPSGKVSPM